ncbi:MAG: tRNA (guanosine(37)-N1)-methyltransferase TrmD [Spirochaetaceae bacterium]|jgi:tRNA (guanine37-N1)-methyltransferase|nr:tRNA (guanosine(37)-N1)-methyltransferase TrmD [Spirochaetaceae bacterium]
MNFTVLTLFPEIIDAYFSASIMSKALDRGLTSYRTINIRDFAVDKHKTCDDAPYGGGAGMLLLAEPLARALDAAGVRQKDQCKGEPAIHSAHSAASPGCRKTIYLTPSGTPFTQKKAAEIAQIEDIVLICGRYEGIDQRIIDLYVDEEISVGDYVLSSGEVAALIIIDAVYRLLDTVITSTSLDEESFSNGLLEYPQWTRPEEFASLKVPEVLLSGHHERIRRWRLERRIEMTLKNRPDLLEKGMETGLFDDETVRLIEEIAKKRSEGAKI